ncbi:MAG: DUF533 domain-containing protein [Xanthomonadales bacterium]|nr:DUF533 domain-containing protein [Xanthomonadales bacterium]
MFDPERMLGQMLSGALGGALGGGGRRRGAFGGSKAVVGVGLLGVAMAAWEHYSAQQKAAPAVSSPPPPPQSLAQPPASAPPPPPAASGSAETRPIPMLDLRRQQALLLMRTMIAAAAADGTIDDAEQRAITQRAEALGDDAEALDFLRRELAAPSKVEQLVAQAPRSMADEVYAAALAAVSVDTERERAWLVALADGLGLDAARVAALHEQFAPPSG